MFRAYDSERERLVAVKLFNLDLPPEKVHKLVAGFERLIAAELTHPAVAAPLATGIAGVSAFLAQDYVAAESMDLVVREYGPATPADALRVAAQLAGAIDFAAVSNISHGALHPRDVLLSSDDTRLTGIGVASALEQVGVTAPVRRPYSPPERMAGAAWDRRADVFGLAALIHELLWGRRVSGIGAHAAEGLTEISGGDLAGLRAAFTRALAENPSDRFDTALEFAQALKDAFPGITLAAAPPAPRKLRRVREEEPLLPLDAEIAPPPPPIAAVEVFDIDQVLTKPDQTPDLDLRALEPAWIEPIEAAPDITAHEGRGPQGSIWEAAAAVEHPSSHDPVVPPAGLLTADEPEPLSVLERSRSAVWPLALALMVGLAIGFAGGYGVGSHERSGVAPSAGAPPVGREFTEGAVAATAPPASPAAPKSDAGSQKPAIGNQQSEISNRKSPVSTGQLLVRTRPAGAQVSVDGRDYGRTPLTVHDLAFGAHRVRITHDGFTAEERRIVISASRPQTMTLALAKPSGRELPGSQRTAPAPAAAGHLTGALSVESRPSGASVYLDGKLLGKTPFLLPVIAAGDHAIRLERDGYRHWSSSIRVVASEQNRVTASLER